MVVWKRVLIAGALLVGALAFAGPASAAIAGERLADQELVDRYAPILMLKKNDDLPCGTDGEQYLPSTVDIILGNTDVKLERIARGQPKVVVKKGADAVDISGLSSQYYLNQRGIPYRPGCTYARDSQRLTSGRIPVIYAHIAREEGEPGIALQYWFYYWFNKFNDLHESDWEMIQLAFDGETAQQVLSERTTPTQVAYAQHGGGEVSNWDDSKLDKVGWHPVVYVASGSHASQYESALYLGRGRQGAGLGCDDTRPDSYAVRPVPIVIPTVPTTTEERWLSYRGAWGQKARGFSNGVGGPNMKLQWLHPFTWMEDLRHNTPKMPVSETAGGTATGFFCGAIIVVANTGNFVGNRNWLVVLMALGLLALLLVPIWLTKWRPAPVEPLRQERSAGQLLRVSAVVYRRYALSMLLLVVVVLGFSWSLTRLFQLLSDYTSAEINLNLTTPGIDSLGTFVVFAPAYPIFLFLVGSPIVALLRRVDEGEPVRPWSALREILPLLPRLFWAFFLALLAVSLLAVTVIGIPFAILKGVDWTFAGQEIIFDRKKKARAALSASTKHVRGRWWGVAAVDLALFVIGTVVGPVIGALLIIFTDTPLWTVNLTGLAVFGLALPYMVTTLTVMWLDPRTQAEKAPGALSRLAFWRREETPQPAPQ